MFITIAIIFMGIPIDHYCAAIAGGGALSPMVVVVVVGR